MRPAPVMLRHARATMRHARATMRHAPAVVRKHLGVLRRALRSLVGEDAYRRYLRHASAQHPGLPLMSRRDFYRDAEQRKWSGVSRCC
jgi:uncharacterized short protein YbdD (DUF466 family)